MRRWVAALVMALMVTGVPVIADAAVHVIKVGNTEFSPASITINRDDVIRWEWESGAPSHVLASGEGPDDILAGEVWDNVIVSGAQTFAERTFDRVGVYKYFSRSRPSMTGTITVVSGPAPVNRETWGYLKKMFEGAARPRR